MSYIKNFARKSIQRTNEETEESASSPPNASNGFGKTIALLACIAGAIYLAQGNHEGWGWLIFLALCLA